MKVISNIGLIVYIYLFRTQQFIFFNNLGYSFKELCIKTLAIDFVIWIILTSITLKFI